MPASGALVPAAAAPSPATAGALTAPAGTQQQQPQLVHSLSGHASAIMLLECDEQRVAAAARDLQVIFLSSHLFAHAHIYVFLIFITNTLIAYFRLSCGTARRLRSEYTSGATAAASAR